MQPTTVATTLTVLGTTDDITACDCCGRTDLKSTVALDLDGGIVHYGVVCAANALRCAAKDIRNAARKADTDREIADKRAADAIRDAEFSRWAAFLAANGTGSDVFTRIQSLGGYAAAKLAYRANPLTLNP